VTYLRLASPKGSARVALLSEPSQPLPPELAEIDLPTQSPARLRERIAEEHARLEAIAARTAELGALRPAMHAAREQVRQDLAFEAVRSGMAEQGQLASLSGWVPAGNLPALRAEAAARAWGLCADDPSAEELPPTKVESNAVVRIIAPVFKFLGTVPGYREYDISSVFLVFFSLYFAMIFGDGGYGLILLAAGVAGALKARRGGRPVSDAVRLLLVLASTTVAWGVATGSFFALPFERLPGFLRAAALPAISNDNPESGTNIKIFCFIVGAVQISLAHIRNIVRDFPRPQFLAQLGSLAMVIGMFVAVLNLVVDSNRFPLSSWVVITIGAGFILVFIFGSWEGTLLKSLLAGLKGIIPTFLGTVSVFADVVSYIRLWAVGLAGVAISQTVNGMAAGMFGEPAGRIVAFAIGAVMGVVLIAVGHALNVVMTVLSVIVHGIRLNMLEFSMHLGMEWSGYNYDPFRETVRADTTNQKEST
jgi:V/A-type H+-transporting ATPase subunit I